MSEAPDPYLRLHAVRIFVRDLDRSLRFYLDQLGFRLVFDTRLQSGRALGRGVPARRHRRLSPSSPPGRSPSSTSSSAAPRRSSSSPRTCPAEFQRVVAEARRPLPTSPRLRRIKYDPAPAAAAASPRLLGEEAPVWGGVFARFRDVDGNTFSLVSFDEVSRTPWRRSAAPPPRSSRPSAAPSTSSRSRGRSRPGSSPSRRPALGLARLRRALHPGARGGRRLLRLPEPRPGPAGPRHRRRRWERGWRPPS